MAQAGPPGSMVVTERMPAFTTMTMTWSPERAGNWLFHCHFAFHLLPPAILEKASLRALVPPADEHAQHANHAMSAMSGIVMGIKVVPVGAAMPPGGLPNDMALKRAGVTWGGYLLWFIPLLGALVGGILVMLNAASQLWDKPLQQTFADKFAGTVVVKIK